jgi:hypothetical protein
LLSLFFDIVVVGSGCGVGHQQVIGSWGFVENLDAHVAEGGDDRFDTFRINDIVRKVVVDFGIGQIAAILAELNQGLEARLARFSIKRFWLFCHCALEQRLFCSLLLGLADTSLRGFFGGVCCLSHEYDSLNYGKPQILP